LKEAQRIAPEAGETYHAQSRIIYYGYLDFERALATLEQAARTLPNNAEVTLTRALLYRRFGRWQEAFAQFQRTMELNPQEPAGYDGAAAVLLRCVGGMMVIASTRVWQNSFRAWPGSSA
jgi:tetratricopeptide (TPR) repeat protein